MGFANRQKFAGRSDINAQFTPENIKRTLEFYNEVKRRGGDYALGELTVLYYHLGKEASQLWESEIQEVYTPDVQEEIKRHIIHALTHRDGQGQPAPIPLTLKWGGAGLKKAIVATYNPSGPSYQIEINGYLGPAALSLAARRAKKKKD